MPVAGAVVVMPVAVEAVAVALATALGLAATILAASDVPNLGSGTGWLVMT